MIIEIAIAGARRANAGGVFSRRIITNYPAPLPRGVANRGAVTQQRAPLAARRHEMTPLGGGGWVRLVTTPGSFTWDDSHIMEGAPGSITPLIDHFNPYL